MFSLEEQFPEVYHQCIPGNFAAELSDGVFSRVETDKVIKMTINKGTKNTWWKHWFFNKYWCCKAVESQCILQRRVMFDSSSTSTYFQIY